MIFKILSIVLFAISFLFVGWFMNGEEADLKPNLIYSAKTDDESVVTIKIDKEHNVLFFIGYDEELAKLQVTIEGGVIIINFWERSNGRISKEVGMRMEDGLLNNIIITERSEIEGARKGLMPIFSDSLIF